MSLANDSMDPVPGDAARSDDVSDVEVARLLESYLAGLEAGLPADPKRLIDDHPHLAERLRACLRVLQVAGQAARGATAVTGALSGRPAAIPSRGAWPGLSELSTIDFGAGEPPHVLLRELPDEQEPLLRTRSAAMPPEGASVGRYQLQGEIARGGMGAVLKGRDVDLGRDLAIKVLLETHQANPEVVRRFVEEAQIGGQLQHPGVVPVYELGTFPDRRPYFAMKLVKGCTLASLLQARTSPAQDLPRFLAIFEQVCQTMAYAHARGVIHRDLKSSNVMVGGFGEVQVMDWGLAKVLPRGGVADEGQAEQAQETVIMTVRSASSAGGSDSQAGSVLGTPAYMAPEQARGEVERIDERADVFGLGAMLCEILTGRPPYLGSSREAIRERAARGDLADALRRLDACGADDELIALTKDCLSAMPERRPRAAGAVARRVSAYQAGVQERLKAAELARVEAQTKAAEERKRRRVTISLAASVLITAGVIGGGWAYLARQHTSRLLATSRVVTDALSEMERYRGQAQSAAVGDLTKWSEAIGAAKRARDLLAEGEADDALRGRVAAVLADLEQEQAAARQRSDEIKRDRKLLAELEAIRGNRGEHWDPKQSDAEYAAAFRAFGIDLDQLDPKEAGKQIVRRSAPVELTSYLDDWVLVRRKARGKQDEASWQRLLAAAQVADPDPWRVALRDQIGRDDREALRRLAADQRTQEVQPAPSLVLFAAALIGQGDRAQAEQALRRAWRLYPGDFWVNQTLGEAHWSGNAYDPGSHYDRPNEAVRFLSACVAIRPRSVWVRVNLGIALDNLGQLEEAITEYREAIRIRPDDTKAHYNLGHFLFRQGKLEAAIAAYRETLRLNPTFHAARVNLSQALRDVGKSDEAIAMLREGVRLEGDWPGGHLNLGNELFAQGKLEEAKAAYREALRLWPDFPFAHENLGLALRSQGKFAEAITELRKARDLAKANPELARQIPGFAQKVEGERAATERQASLAARLPAILADKLKPTDAAEALGFAELCYEKKLHGASARLWAEAFQAQPRLADDMKAQHRYNASCAAALAGCGQGKDDPPLDEATRARWRKQAIDWLKADLAAWSKFQESGPPRAAQPVTQTLMHWKSDSDLAGLRDTEGLAKLPEEERNACRALWADVDALMAKSRGVTAP